MINIVVVLYIYMCICKLRTYIYYIRIYEKAPTSPLKYRVKKIKNS